jgi:ribulose 1,5-bisphosphate synthetase/thiazole synthase
VRANGIDIHLVMHDTREPVDRAESTEVVVIGAGPTGLTARCGSPSSRARPGRPLEPIT